jgi:ribonuclease HIII
LSDSEIEIAPYIGTDESGKGDFFGPLVVAAVAVTPQDRDRLLALDVKDSKKMTDKKARRIAEDLRGLLPCEVVAIGPEKYNDLYVKIRNLNRLLAWAHARAIENVLGRTDVTVAVTDQFGDPGYVERALMEKGKTISLIQQTKGERFLGVAAASIVARAKFLESLEKLESLHGVPFPKGAGPTVDSAAAEFCRRAGVEQLRLVAKLHFKNSKKVSDILQHNSR